MVAGAGLARPRRGVSPNRTCEIRQHHWKAVATVCGGLMSNRRSDAGLDRQSDAGPRVVVSQDSGASGVGRGASLARELGVVLGGVGAAVALARTQRCIARAPYLVVRRLVALLLPRLIAGRGGLLQVQTQSICAWTTA